MSRASSPLAKIGRFDTKNPEDLSRQIALLEKSLRTKAQNDENSAPYAITTKQVGTYNGRAWEIARIDTTAQAGFVILPDPLDVLGVWIGVKFAAGVTNHPITVSAVNATIDGSATFTMNIAWQFSWFYATPDGWETERT